MPKAKTRPAPLEGPVYQVSVDLSAPMKAALERYCTVHQATQSTVMRSALAEVLDYRLDIDPMQQRARSAPVSRAAGPRRIRHAKAPPSGDATSTYLDHMVPVAGLMPSLFARLFKL